MASEITALNIGIPFVGREEFLKSLNTQWESNKIICIHGLRSVGKTRTLFQFLKNRQEELPTAERTGNLTGPSDRNLQIVYVDLRTLNTFDAVCSHLCAQLEIELKQVHRNVAYVVTQITSVVCKTQNYVFIFDNAEDAVENTNDHFLIELCSELAMKCKTIKIVLTSTTRASFAGIGKCYASMELLPMTYAESFDFLERLTKTVEFSEQFDSIVTLCEGLPLIILMVASELLSGTTPTQMVEFLIDCRIEALSKDTYPSDDRVELMTLITFRASDNAVLRERKTAAPRASQNGSFQDKIVSTPPLPTSEEAMTFTKSAVILATFVRLLLIGHNVLTVWRVTVTYNDEMYWLLLIANVLLIAEGMFTVCRRGGIDYKWWCPCFLIYLASTLPAIWLLQLKQYEIATGQSISGDSTTADSLDDVVTTPAVPITTTIISTALTSFEDLTTIDAGNATTALVNYTTTSVDNATSNTGGDITSPFNNTTLSMRTQASSSGQINAPSSEVWLIIVEESLIYLLVSSRWLLPRRDMSREFLADLLLEFLAIASDIMELLAVFDESQVRENLMLTYWVMAVWSASFIQFIPVLAQKRMFRHLRAPQRRLFTRCCGDSFVEIAYTCMSIFLQDGPFLVLRLFIMIQLKLIKYSLVFFVLKNAVTVILLVYRLGIMCYRLPCCRGQKQKNDDNDMTDIGNSEDDLFENSTESLDDKV